MDGRLLKACQLLMEFAAAQLEQTADDGEQGSEDTGQGTGDRGQRSADEKQWTTDRPMTDYGDNPNFDPARFDELRRVGAAAAAPASVSEPGFESGPMKMEKTVAPEAPLFPTPPRSAFSVQPLTHESEARRESQTVRSGGPTASLTMRDISDHFERDARRY